MKTILLCRIPQDMKPTRLQAIEMYQCTYTPVFDDSQREDNMLEVGVCTPIGFNIPAAVRVVKAHWGDDVSIRFSTSLYIKIQAKMQTHTLL